MFQTTSQFNIFRNISLRIFHLRDFIGVLIYHVIFWYLIWYDNGIYLDITNNAKVRCVQKLGIPPKDCRSMGQIVSNLKFGNTLCSDKPRGSYIWICLRNPPKINMTPIDFLNHEFTIQKINNHLQRLNTYKYTHIMIIYYNVYIYMFTLKKHINILYIVILYI